MRNRKKLWRRWLALLAALVLVTGVVTVTAGIAQGQTWSCTVTGPDTSCPVTGNGDYNDYPGIIMSNGWGTYVANNCLDDGACPGQKLEANDGTDWQVTANEPAGNGSVEVGPELQQQTNDWCTDPGTNYWATVYTNCVNQGNAPVSGMSSWTSNYTDYLPHNIQTIAEAAYDIWTNYTADIMVWQDTVGRCNPGSYGQTDLAMGVHIGGHVYDVRRYGAVGGEIIFTEEGAGGPGTCAQDSSGTVDLLGVLNEVQSLGIVSNITVGLVDFTFEVCSTGGSPETFGVSSYGMTTTKAGTPPPTPTPTPSQTSTSTPTPTPTPSQTPTSTPTPTPTQTPPGGAVAAVASGSSGNLSSSALSWTQDVSGSDRALLAGVTVGGNSSQSVTVTDNGVAMTPETGRLNTNNQQAGFLQVFGLVNPPAGVNTIQVTASGMRPDSLTGGSVSFGGVSQADPFGAPVTDYGSGPVASVTTAGSTAGDLVAGFIGNGSPVHGVSSPAVSRYAVNVTDGNGAGNSAGATLAADGASDTLTWNVTGDWWAIAALEVNHA